MSSLPSLACTAFNVDGSRCSCTHWSKRTRKDQCRGCRHGQSYHQPPPPAIVQQGPGPSQPITVSSIVAKVAARQGLQPRVTDDEAYLEAKSGFRPKRGTASTSASGATGSPRRAGPSQSRKGTTSGKKGKLIQEKLTNVGYVILLPGGLNDTALGSDGFPRFQLLDTVFPGPSLKHALGDAGLIAYPRQNQTLSFSPSWSQNRIDEWLRELFSEFFTYCDLRYGTREGSDRSDYHWALVERDRKTITLVRRPDSLTGEDLHRARSTPGRSTSMSCLIFVSRYVVIPAIYTDFPRAIDYVLEDTIEEFEHEAASSQPQANSNDQHDDLKTSDDDSDESPLSALSSPETMAPTKDKGKGKSKAKSVTSDQNSDSDSGEDWPKSAVTQSRKSSSSSKSFAPRRSNRLASSSKLQAGQKRNRSPTPSSDNHEELGRHGAKRAKPEVGLERAYSPIEVSDNDDNDNDITEDLFLPQLSSPAYSYSLLNASSPPPPNQLALHPAPPAASTSNSTAVTNPQRAWTPSDDNYYVERAKRGLPSPPKPKYNPWATGPKND